MIKKYLVFAFLGGLMGFVLARIGFADYDEVHKMFTFADLRMFTSFAIAVVFTMVFALLLRKYYPKQHKIFQPGLVPGSMLFGFGWAITGACPSLVFVQLGQGRLPAVMTLVGIFVGVVLYKKIHGRFFMWDTGSCSA